MTEMIEKVARALLKADLRRTNDHETVSAQHIIEEGWPGWVNAARAAIAAHEKALEEQGLVIVPREPGDGMKSAGDSMMPQFSEGCILTTGYDVAGEVWQAMIAALEGKP